MNMAQTQFSRLNFSQTAQTRFASGNDSAKYTKDGFGGVGRKTPAEQLDARLNAFKMRGEGLKAQAAVDAALSQAGIRVKGGDTRWTSKVRIVERFEDVVSEVGITPKEGQALVDATKEMGVISVVAPSKPASIPHRENGSPSKGKDLDFVKIK